MDPQHPDLSAEPAPDTAAEPGPVDPEEEDLAGGLAGLAGLSSARLSLEDLLTEVASFAVQAIPGADGAGVDAAGGRTVRTPW